MKLSGSRLECLAIDAEGEQCIARTELLEDVAGGGQRLWSEMMPRLRRKRIFPKNTARGIRRSVHHGGSFVVRLVGLLECAAFCRQLVPRGLKLCAITFGVVAFQKRPIRLDAAGDHGFAGLHEDWTSLFAVRLQQRFAAPALQRSRQ